MMPWAVTALPPAAENPQIQESRKPIYRARAFDANVRDFTTRTQLRINWTVDAALSQRVFTAIVSVKPTNPYLSGDALDKFNP